ncbi:hypothetical protein GOP47_0002361 [Adiantum capillus-veneris]|uniref:Uncharacterized protein n=1 Tax=Adiantum capillus-veneris TaxID=13818 RepID=A0A9D4VAH0_ADICA|nr:hypothetical protein GOP47_0002361 [Adiantum capillus-veneris]
MASTLMTLVGWAEPVTRWASASRRTSMVTRWASTRKTSIASWVAELAEVWRRRVEPSATTSRGLALPVATFTTTRARRDGGDDGANEGDDDEDGKGVDEDGEGGEGRVGNGVGDNDDDAGDGATASAMTSGSGKGDYGSGGHIYDGTVKLSTPPQQVNLHGFVTLIDGNDGGIGPRGAVHEQQQQRRRSGHVELHNIVGS